MEKNEVEEPHTHTVEKKWTVGPGIKHAIIWISFIVTFVLGMGVGWYAAVQHYKGDSARAEVEVLHQDTEVGMEILRDKLEAKEILNEKRKTRSYDKDCSDKPIRDVIK